MIDFLGNIFNLLIINRIILFAKQLKYFPKKSRFFLILRNFSPFLINDPLRE